MDSLEDHSPLHLHWLKQDALRFGTFTFRPAARRQILDEIHPRPKADVENALIRALEGTVSFYRARRAFESNHAPMGAARRKVAALVATVDELDRALGEFDWGTRRALAPFFVGETEPSLPPLSARKPEEMSVLDRRLILAREELAAIAEHARAFLKYTTPKKGGPRALNAREAFAVDIADALQEHVPDRVAIVSTAGGAYETIVRVSLEAAAGAARGDMRRIITSAVKAFGATYRPQGVKRPPL